MMDETDAELDGRLQLLRDLAEPAHADKLRLIAALRVALGANHAGEPSEPALERVTTRGRARRWATAARPIAPWLGRICVAASVMLAMGGVWTLFAGQQDAPQSVPRGGPSMAAHSTPGATGPVEAAKTARASGERAAPSAAAELGLAEALEELHHAQRSLYAGDAARALEILADLERRAGPAVLREERLTTRVLALCHAGRVEDALGVRRELDRESPRSIYAQRLDQSCAPGFEPR